MRYVSRPSFNVFISAVFSGYKATVLGPLATALTIIPIFTPAATFPVLAAETVLLKRDEDEQLCCPES